jgi:hypothetical protein
MDCRVKPGNDGVNGFNEGVNSFTISFQSLQSPARNHAR